MINVTKPLLQESAVALGLFDGIHLGHQKVLAAAVQCSKDGLLPCAFTFNASTFPKKHGRELEFLYTEEYKQSLLENIGIKAVLTANFFDIGEMNGESFCRNILKDMLHAKKVFCGSDFRFGKDAACSFTELAEFGRNMGFKVICIDSVCIDGSEVSSTRIREYLNEGRIEKAQELFGRPYAVSGTVVHGKKLGRTINFPTINQNFQKGQLVPAKGVYLSRVSLTDDRRYFGVTNVVVKPTVSYENIPLAETHLLDFKGDLYGVYCTTELLHFIRPEKKFENIKALQTAIMQDIEKARKLALSI